MCREACGRAGYLAEEGDDTVLLQLVAKGLLTDYRDSFGKLDPLGTAKFIAAQAVEIAVGKSALRNVVERLGDVVLNRNDAVDPDARLPRVVRQARPVTPKFVAAQAVEIAVE